MKSLLALIGNQKFINLTELKDLTGTNYTLSVP